MIMASVFLGCFGLGLLLTAGSFLGGPLHLGHLHFGGHGIHPGHRGTGPWLNAFSLAAFLCWFGGVGYLLQHEHSFTTLLVVLLALAAGCTGAACISLFLTKVLMRNERPLLPEDTEMRGVLARVSNRVRAGGTGEIIFTLNGTRRCSAARAHGSQTLKKGDEVVVLAYSRGIAWVAPFHEDVDAVRQVQGTAS